MRNLGFQNKLACPRLLGNRYMAHQSLIRVCCELPPNTLPPHSTPRASVALLKGSSKTWHTAPPLPAASGLSCQGMKSRFPHWEERVRVGRTGGFELVALKNLVLSLESPTPPLKASSLSGNSSPTELSPTRALGPFEKGKLGRWVVIPEHLGARSKRVRRCKLAWATRDCLLLGLAKSERKRMR